VHRIPRGRYRDVLLNIALLVGVVLACCIASELVLRVAFARTMDFSMEMWKYGAQLKQPVADPRLSFAHVPNRSAFLMGVQVAINSHGLRDHEYSLSKPPDVYRIVMLGDSTTFGWGVTLEQTAAKILEAELNKLQVTGYNRFEVLNAGVGNYGTVQEVTHYLTYDRDFHPDLVILQYFINDAEPVPIERQPFLLGQSYLLAYATSRFDSMMRSTGISPQWKQYYAGLYEDGLPGLEAAKQALATLASHTRADGTKLLVTILPELREINHGYPFVSQHQTIKEVLAAHEVPVIELIEGLRDHGPESSLWVTEADAHPNGKANALVAAQILGWIRANL
jgi:lysophospholipase L1-like esterase